MKLDPSVLDIEGTSGTKLMRKLLVVMNYLMTNWRTIKECALYIDVHPRTIERYFKLFRETGFVLHHFNYTYKLEIPSEMALVKEEELQVAKEVWDDAELVRKWLLARWKAGELSIRAIAKNSDVGYFALRLFLIGKTDTLHGYGKLADYLKNHYQLCAE